MPNSNHTFNHSDTAQNSSANSHSLNNARLYDTGAFSTNVTPPLNSKHVSQLLNPSTGPTTSTSTSSSTPQRPSMFGGRVRATDYKEMSYEISSTSTSCQTVDIWPLYSGNRPAETITAARRMSFTTSKVLEMYAHGTTSLHVQDGSAIEGNGDQANLPVIPDELMAVLALPAGSSINTDTVQNPTLLSGISLHTESSEDSLRKESVPPSSSHNMPKASAAMSSNAPTNNTLYSDSLAPNLPESHGTARTRQRKSLRKAASAESLLTSASMRSGVNPAIKMDNMLGGMRGLGIIGSPSNAIANSLQAMDVTTPITDPNSKSASSARSNHHHYTAHFPTRTADVKAMWKSISSRLHVRNPVATGSSSTTCSNVNQVHGKESDTSSTFTPQSHKNETGTLGLNARHPDGRILRKSFESTVRYSLSIYPRPRIDKDSLRSRNNESDYDRQQIIQSNEVIAASQISLSKSEIDSVSGESNWMTSEQFTHDLSQRSKKTHKHPPNFHETMSPGREPQGANGTLGDRFPEDEQEELDVDQLSDDEDDNVEEEEDDEEDDQASQIAFIDPMLLGPSNSLPNLCEDNENVIVESLQGQEGQFPADREDHHPPAQRRSTGPNDIPKSMAATLQRNRADSNVVLPPRISTDLPPSITLLEVGSAANDTTSASNLDLSPPRLTPDTASTVYMDAFSSPLLSGPLSPAQIEPSFSYFPDKSPPPEDPVQREEEIRMPNINSQRPNAPGPPSPVYIARPRSMSESFLSTSAPIQGGSGGMIEVRASQQNNKNILSTSLRDRRVIGMKGTQFLGLTEQQQREVGHLSDTSRATVFGGGGETSENTTTNSSLDLSRGSPTSKRSNAHYTVAIVGPKQVGKSTIIAQNLKLSSDKCSVLYEDVEGNKVISYSGSYSITGRPCTLNVLEVDMDVLHSTSEGLSWPATVSRPEGVMICYKYGDPKGLEQLKTLLHGFWTRGGIHLIALATQCPPVQESSTPYKAEGDKAAEICNIHGAGLVHLDGGIEDPNRKARNSLQWILRKIVESKGQGSRSPSRIKRPVIPKKSIATLIAEQAVAQELPVMTTGTDGQNLVTLKSEAGHSSNTVSSMSCNSAVPEDGLIDEKFLMSKFGHSQMDIYLSREDLVQKLLFAAVAGNDEEYIATFLIVYRRFKSPYEVLNAWLERFQTGDSHLDDDSLLSRYVQMKLCNLLARWVRFHRSDFCNGKTADLLNVIVERLYMYSWVHHYAIEIEELVKGISNTADQDAPWTLPDQLEESALHTRLASTKTNLERKASLAASTGTTLSQPSSDQALFTSFYAGTPATSSFGTEAHLSVEKESAVPPMPPLEKTPSRSSSKKRFGFAGTASSELPPLPPNTGTQQSQKMEAMLDLSDTFLDCAVQLVAVQITRHAWSIFASMQPRDLLRYVMTPRDPKNPDLRPQRNADNPVTEAVAFSNYLSNWTASVLLVQSKQKTRARAFEHLIRLALALRNLDNLDSLMAVLVGLNCTPVHRLHDLATSVPENVYKKFRSMNFLMASTRSFAAYRLALTTARPEVIPYLAVHLQDITRVHDSKSDMRDGLVNWSKMRQIGKYASVVTHCSRLTPHYPHDERLSQLVMDAPVFSLDDDDDTLYELSYTYRPRQKRSGSSGRRAKLKRLLKEANQYTRIKLV